MTTASMCLHSAKVTGFLPSQGKRVDARGYGKCGACQDNHKGCLYTLKVHFQGNYG